MPLTDNNRAYIDSLSYVSLLEHWRNAPVGDEWFTGETGTYWAERMQKLRAADPAASVAASKEIGWEGRP